MAMLIAFASMPSVQAHAAYVDGHGASLVNLPALADHFDDSNGAVYLAEESEVEAAQKSSSQRFGGDQPPVVVSLFQASVIFAALFPLSSEQSARVDCGTFRSPHKTGPPHI
jgi:hypothetical protein